MHQCFIFTLDSSTGGIFTLAVIILNDQQQTSGVSQNCLMGFQAPCAGLTWTPAERSSSNKELSVLSLALLAVCSLLVY